MTPHTRSGNKDANFQVYYSKKVPQQVHFPHKRKTVRRRSTPVRDESEKRQMVFLPEKMKAGSAKAVMDSDEEDDDEPLEEDTADGGTAYDANTQDVKGERGSARIAKRGGKRRSSALMQEGDEEDEGPVRPTFKRRRTAAASTYKRRSRQIKAEPEEDMGKARTLRRQSTMTQLVYGRRPLPDVDEPDFQPVRQGPRLSWSEKLKNKEKDKQQRTLTQMIAGMRPPEIMSDEDMDEALSDIEAQEKDSQAYGDAVARRLAQQGYHRADDHDGEEAITEFQGDDGVQPVANNGHSQHELPAYVEDVPTLVVPSVENATGDDMEDAYQPTQYITAPVRRTNRATRQRTRMQDEILQAAEVGSARAGKSRFSLLSTPEKRRIREIPSSQSPAESPLSTQVSPRKSRRSPLKERSGNTVKAPETPSERKRVAFDETKPLNPPSTLRKFRSVIQDSEDEEDEIIEDDMLPNGRRISARMHAPMCDADAHIPSKAVGADTQAILEQIDQACAHTDESVAGVHRDSSEELGSSATLAQYNEPSPELGEPPKQTAPEEHPYRTVHVGIKQEPSYDDEDMTVLPTAGPPSPHETQPIANVTTTKVEAEPSTLQEQLHSTPPSNETYLQETFPSTPMVIQDDSSDEEDESGLTPLRMDRHAFPPTTSTDPQQSADLDGESVQVPRSPSVQHETQQSHSSKAEQQLQNEWFSYSQYVNTRPPQSSSMNVAHDVFSYNTTPKPPRNTAPLLQPSSHHISQATTVDEVTPRKNRTQQIMSANSTPHRIASSQPAISPSKPPPLFIPSSFPSPAKAAMEGWSSPTLGRTQEGFRSSQLGASLEEFSIPLPPPVEDD